MRRPLVVALLAGSLLVGCSEPSTEPSQPSSPGLTTPAQPDVGPTGCSLNNLLDLTAALFPATTRTPIIAVLKALPTRAQDRLANLVRAVVFGIVDAVTKAYNAGRLSGGKSATTQANLLAFLNGLYCFVGMSPPNIPPGALDPNEGALAVVTPTSGAMTIQTQSKHGALALQARTVPTTTLLAVTFLPSTSFPLLTSLDQYPLFYEFSSSPEVTFTKDVTAAVCLAATNTVPLSQLSLAHNVGSSFGDVEVLPPPPPSQTLPVDCSNVLASRPTPWTARGLFASVFLPQELNAATALIATTGVGGTTKKFSPFGVVDRLSNPGSIAANGVPTSFSVAPAATVTPAPSVVVKSHNGRPIANVPVVFTASAGSSVGGVGHSSQTVVTDASGVATAGPWIAGPAGADYTLTATPPDLPQVGEVAPYRPAATFAPASVVFTATTAGPIGYLATGYRYRIFSEGSPPEGFAGPGFDDSEWATGNAAFGHDGPDHCPLITAPGGVSVDWPANSQIVARKVFAIPGGGGSAVVSVAIDNDVKVFVNGTDITSTALVNGEAGHPPVFDDAGFARHDNCPTAGSLTFTATGLNPGVNLLVVQGKDRGSSTYLDVKVE